MLSGKRKRLWIGLSSNETWLFVSWAGQSKVCFLNWRATMLIKWFEEWGRECHFNCYINRSSSLRRTNCQGCMRIWAALDHGLDSPSLMFGLDGPNLMFGLDSPSLFLHPIQGDGCSAHRGYKRSCGFIRSVREEQEYDLLRRIEYFLTWGPTTGCRGWAGKPRE